MTSRDVTCRVAMMWHASFFSSADPKAEVVHFAQDSTTRRSHSATGGGSSGGGGASAYNTDHVSNTPAAGNGLFRADSAGEERLGKID